MKTIQKILCLTTILSGLYCHTLLAQEAGSPPPPAKNELKEKMQPNNKPVENPTPIIVPDNGGNYENTTTYNTGQSLSPTTQNLVNSINTSVNLYTGTANVSIPICTLPAEQVNLPISLQYTAGNGVKIDDDPDGMVGQGWNLQAGGMITRMVRGLPDEVVDGYAGANSRGNTVTMFLSGSMTNVYDRFNHYKKVTNEEWDSETDIFYFVLPTGLSGKFVLQANGQPMTIPYQPVTIKPAIGRAATQNYWEIITQDGVKYKFGVGQEYIETTEETIYLPNENPKTKTYPSTWNINNIATAENQIIATFTYRRDMVSSQDFWTGVITTSPRIKENTRYVQHQFYETWRNANNCDDCPSIEGLKTIAIKNKTIALSILDKIETSQATMAFGTYDLDCIGAILGGIPGACHEFRYRSLQLQGANLSKTWSLKYAYFPDNQRTKLVEIKPNDTPATQFFYNESITLPPPNTLVVQQDWWGYYNSNPHTTLLPPYNGQAGANREPDEMRTQAYILNKIVNPLGAVTELEYEGHRYNASGIEKRIGGVRVKAIHNKTSDNSSAKVITKQYLYKLDNNTNTSSGILLNTTPLMSIESRLTFECRMDVLIPISAECYRRFARLNSSPLNPVASADYIGYKVVTEKSQGNGKTVSTFSSAETYSDEYDFTRSVRYYGAVFIGQDYPHYTQIPKTATTFQWRRGLNLSTSVYDANSNLKTIKKYFYSFNQRNKINSIVFFKKDHAAATFVASVDLPMYSAYSDISEAISLTRTEEYVYDQTPPNSGASAGANDFLKSEVGYSYTADNQPKEVRKILPTGEMLITRTRYAKDVVAVQNTCMQQLQTCSQQCPTPVQLTCAEECQDQYDACLANFNGGIVSNEMSAALTALIQKGINAPVETTTWLQKSGADLKLLSASLTTYKQFGNFVRAYQNFQLRIKAADVITETGFAHATINNSSGAFEQDARYELLETNEYSAVNGLAVENTPHHGQPSAVVYDLRKNPIAKVANAKATQVFYDGFEAWAAFAAAQPTIGAKTGVVAHNCSVNGGYSFLAPPVQDQWAMYELSYWTLSSGGTAWELIEETLDYNGLQLHTFPSSGWIDDIRIHPVGSLMTTTTYKPLIGKTSETDANMRTVYYEYDNLHRLQYVKDEKKNILEAYQYNVTR